MRANLKAANGFHLVAGVFMPRLAFIHALFAPVREIRGQNRPHHEGHEGAAFFYSPEKYP
jgi:hypothetical protein